MPDGRFIVTGFNGAVTVVDVSDLTAPVEMEVETVGEAFAPSWQPSP